MYETFQDEENKNEKQKQIYVTQYDKQYVPIISKILWYIKLIIIVYLIYALFLRNMSFGTIMSLPKIIFNTAKNGMHIANTVGDTIHTTGIAINTVVPYAGKAANIIVQNPTVSVGSVALISAGFAGMSSFITIFMVVIFIYLSFKKVYNIFK